MPDPITPSGAIAWVDDIAPDQAIGVCGAKMGRLAELYRAGVNLPKGFTVTVEAFRRHWEQAGLAEVADTALGGLGAGAEAAEIEAAAAAVRAAGVAFSAHPVTGKTDRVVIETSWGWGEAVVQGLVTPDHIEVGKADGRILKYQVADKTVVSAFDYAAGRVVETEMPARLVSQQVLADEQ